MKLERADSCESSHMSFLENQKVVPGESERSPRVYFLDPRMTTHNCACALKGLSDFPGIKLKLECRDDKMSLLFCSRALKNKDLFEAILSSRLTQKSTVLFFFFVSVVICGMREQSVTNCCVLVQIVV